jgi:hypothetical protein
MFNLLISADKNAWEKQGKWEMQSDRFKEYSGEEAVTIIPKDRDSLKLLEGMPSLLMCEWTTDNQIVRYGTMNGIKVAGRSIQFSFSTESHCQRNLVDQYAEHLGMHDFERHRTHWAIKDGDIPRDMIRQMTSGPSVKHRYEVVLSYAGEDESYVSKVASLLKDRDVELFYAPFKEADLWGTDLSEELDVIYRMEGRFCVMFLSEHYARKAWPTHERRSALSRSVQQRQRYILPCRFDHTEVPGLPPSVHYVNLKSKTPLELTNLILEVLGRQKIDD